MTTSDVLIATSPDLRHRLVRSVRIGVLLGTAVGTRRLASAARHNQRLRYGSPLVSGNCASTSTSKS
jgi:hypothetical protein